MIVALIDYRAGNLTSVRKALATLGATLLTPDGPDDLAQADAIIVPGVGHFEATAALDARWHDAIRAHLDAGGPLLGICLGQQWLFEGSEEAPHVPGLGVLPGRCVRLETGDATLKVPHVGWNALRKTGRPSRLLAGVDSEAQAYFTHSYVAPDSEATVATTEHGVTFASVVEHGLVFGAQFHPEKSGTTGLRMLQNFLDVARDRNGRTASANALAEDPRQHGEVDGRRAADQGSPASPEGVGGPGEGR